MEQHHSRIRFWPRSIRARVVAVALLGVAIVALIPIYDDIQERQDAKERQRESILLTSRIAAQAEQERYQHMRDVLFFTSQFRRVTDAIPAPRNELVLADCQLALAAVAAALPQTTGIRLSEPDGDLICSNTQPAATSQNIADRPFFQRTIEKNEFVIGDYQVGGTSGRPIQSFAAPLHDAGGNIIAVINSGLWLDTEDPLVVTANLPPGAEITLIDRKGLVLRSTKYAPGDQFERLGGDESLAEPTLLKSPSGGGMVYAVTRITTPGESPTLAIVSIKEKAFLASILDDLVPNMAAILLLALLTGAAIWLLIERLLGQPVKKLTTASERIAGGDLSARVNVSDGTELQTLGEHFNVMGEQLESRAAALEEALAVKDEFLGLVSHELRTPLTIVLGNARVLQARAATLDDTTRQAALEDIVSEGQRLNRIINNLMVLARLESGQAPEVEPLHLSRVVRVSTQDLAFHLRRRITLADAEPDAWAIADAGYVEQILTNLISNAVKYSPPTEPVAVSLAREGDDWAIAVADTGPGIPDDERARIFEPFYRSHRTSDTSAGMGIGLAVCARLATALNGRLNVAGRAGGGTVFTLSIPAYDVADDLADHDLTGPNEPDTAAQEELAATTSTP